MEPDYIFVEKQRFSQPWIWIILITINAVFLRGIYIQFIEKEPFGSYPTSDLVLILLTAGILLFSIGLLTMRMETRINHNGVFVRYAWFQSKPMFYPWTKIQMCYLRTFSPWWDFGGWGVRARSQSKAYLIKGNHGLQLKFTNRKRLVIGTQRPVAMEQALKQIPGCPLYPVKNDPIKSLEQIKN